jgi:hypothetical protein
VGRKAAQAAGGAGQALKSPHVVADAAQSSAAEAHDAGAPEHLVQSQVPSHDIAMLLLHAAVHASAPAPPLVALLPHPVRIPNHAIAKADAIAVIPTPVRIDRLFACNS